MISKNVSRDVRGILRNEQRLRDAMAAFGDFRAVSRAIAGLNGDIAPATVKCLRAAATEGARYNEFNKLLGGQDGY